MTVDTTPIISIIIPTKDRANLLKETVKSLLEQTLSHWEAVVIDDGSKDDTNGYIEQLARDDQRVKYIPRINGNSGAPACRNIGIKHSRGRYLLFLDSDDCLAPYALATRVEALDRRRDLDFIASLSFIFWETPGDSDVLWNRHTYEDVIDRFLQADVPWTTMGTTWRREALDIVGPWDESLLFWQDWEQHLRALSKNLRYKALNCVDSYWRMPNSTRKSIGDNSKNRTEDQYWAVILKVRNSLAENDLLTVRRKQYLGGMCFWLSERWNKSSGPVSARAIQKKAKQEHLTSKLFYQMSRIYYLGVINKFRPTRLLLKLLLTHYLELNYHSSVIAKTNKRLTPTDAGLRFEHETGRLVPAAPK